MVSSTRPSQLTGPAAALAWLVPALVLVIGGALVLVTPPGRDQAIFALVGETIARGGAPYADAFDFKPPAIHLVYALAARLPLDVFVASHVLELLALAISAWLLHGLVSEYGRTAAAFASAFLLTAYLGTLRYWDLAQPEGFALPFVLGSLHAAVHAGGRRSRWILAGALIGVAALFKYPLVLFALLFPIVGRGSPRDRVAHVRLRALAFVAAGALLPLLATALWLGLTGALDDYVEIQTGYLPGYTKLSTLGGPGRFFSASWEITRRFLGERPLLVWMPLIGLLAARVSVPSRLVVPLLGALLATIGVVAQGKFFHYHWIPLLPFLGWLTGLGAAALIDRLGARTRGAIAATTAYAFLGITCLVFSTSPVVAEKRGARARLLGGLDRNELAASPAFGVPGQGDHALATTMAISKEVSDRAKADDRLFVWGFEPLVYLESGLTPASRFIYTAAFMSPWCPPRWNEELVRTLTERPPEFFVVSSMDAIPWVTGVPLDSRQALASYRPIRDLLRTDYAPIGRVERFTLYSRVDDASSARSTRAAP